eukprot:385873_1
MSQQPFLSKFECCMEEFSTDPTGNQGRQCDHMTLQEEWTKLSTSHTQRLGGTTRPELHFYRPHPGPSSFLQAVVRKTIKANRGNLAELQKKQLYGEYIGDYLVNHILGSITGDLLMKTFQNEIYKGDSDKFEFYFKPYLPMEPFSLELLNQDTYTVANVITVAIIEFLDIVFMYIDRFRLRFIDQNSANNGNCMMHRDPEGKGWRIIPIDNGVMDDYIMRRELRQILETRKDFIEDMIRNKLYDVASDFVDRNRVDQQHPVNNIFPGELDQEMLTKMVYNVWYNYGSLIAKKAETLLLTGWPNRVHDDDWIFDGEGKFLQSYLIPTLAILKEMPANVMDGNTKYGAGKLNWGTSRTKLVKDFTAPTQWAAQEVAAKEQYNNLHVYPDYAQKQYDNSDDDEDDYLYEPPKFKSAMYNAPVGYSGSVGVNATNDISIFMAVWYIMILIFAMICCFCCGCMFNSAARWIKKQYDQKNYVACSDVISL